MSLPKPVTLDPEFKTLLIELADRAERALGLHDTPLTIVTFRKTETDGVIRYVVGVACENSPELLSAMRAAFPRHLGAGARVHMQPLGGLKLEGVTIDHLRAALARTSPE